VASENISNSLPKKVARVIPANVKTTTLGNPNQERVFVAAAEDIKGLDAQNLSLKLGINKSSYVFRIYEFDTPMNGIASPIKYDDPLFTGHGLTIGGLRELTIPNQGIPNGSYSYIIKF